MVRSILLALVVLVTHCDAFGAIIANFTPAENDRFTNSAQFIATAFNVTGVGQTSTGLWGTLISPNVIISANHAQPSGTIFFYPSNDPTSTPVTRTVTANSVRLGGLSDLWIAQLDSNVDPSISVLPFTNVLLSGGPNQIVPAGIYQGLDAYQVGRSGINASPQNQAFGRNIIDGYSEDVVIANIGAITDSLLLGINNSHPFETTLQGGDSGAPLFVDSGGSLLLIGVNSFVGDDGNGNTVVNGATYVGNYAQEIQTFINAVPEPSSLAYVLLATVVLRHRGMHRARLNQA
jgi:hypothetical protein